MYASNELVSCIYSEMGRRAIAMESTKLQEYNTFCHHKTRVDTRRHTIQRVSW